jgi:CheY-like chemotaxis protein
VGTNYGSHLLLVVDDDPHTRYALSEILEQDGYRVACVENGREALEYLRGGERPCVILLDMMMPGMSGWQFLREQQEDTSIQCIPVLMITASDERRVDLIPNNQVLTKPIRVDELLESVHRFC